MIFELFHSIFQLISQILFGIIQSIVIIILTILTQIVHSKTFQSCIELSRPGNSLLAASFVILVAVMAGMNPRYDLQIILTAAAVATLITAGGNTINDYYDRDIDAINKPNRPIPSKRIRGNVALAYSLLLFILGIFMSLFLNPFALTIAIFNSFLLVFYAYDLKKTGFLGNIVISYLTASVFLFGGAVVNTTLSWWIGFVLAACAFLVTAGREIAKDIEDIKGDRKAGARTLPIVLGNAKSALLASAFLVIVTLFSPIPYLLGIFHWYYIVVISIADLLFIYSIYLLLKNPDTKSAAQVQKNLKIAIIIALLAFITGSYKLYELVVSLI